MRNDLPNVLLAPVNPGISAEPHRTWLQGAKAIATLALILSTGFAAQAATYTWVGVSGASWADPTSWSPNRTTPATSDVLQFNGGGAVTVTAVPTQTIGRLLIQSNTAVTLQGSAGTQTLTIGNGTGTDLVIDSGSSLTTDASLETVALAASATADISGTYNNGGDYLSTATGIMTTVNGVFNNMATITGVSAAKLTVASGGKYIHARNGGNIPALGWNAASTCEITGITSTAPGALNQSFGHITWNCTGQTVDVNLPASGMTIAGNLTIMSTGAGSNHIRLAQTPLNIGGNFSLSGGILQIGNASNNRTLSVAGNVTISGGTLEMTTGSLAAGIGTLQVQGNYTHTAGTVTETSTGTGTGVIVFNGSGTQTYISGGTVSNTVNFTVNSGATLQMAADATTVTGGGSFTLSSGATLGITAPAGISSSGATGNIQVSGTRSFNTGANYTYNGSAAQNTGTGLPATVNNLTINNAAGVALSGSVAVNAILYLNNGLLTPGANTLNVVSNVPGAVNGGSATAYVNGSLQRGIAAGANTYAYPIGTATTYAPVSLNFDGSTSAGSLTGSTTDGDHPNIATSMINPALSVNRYWRFAVNSGLGTANYGATFTWGAGDADGGFVFGTAIGSKYDAPNWTALTTSGQTATGASISGASGFSDFQFGDPLCPAITATLALSGASPICPGDHSSIAATISGGTSPYTLVYSDGSNNFTVTSYSSGADIDVSPAANTTYTLVSVTDKANCTATVSGSASVQVTPNPTTANAGPDQTGAATCGLTTVTLAANTPSVGTGAWSVVSGTGGSFADASDPGTNFSGTAGTAYQLRWTISNACTATQSDVHVTFNQNPSTADAGMDRTVCYPVPGTLALAANTPATGQGTWSVVTGPDLGSGQFSDVHAPAAIFTPSTTGTYTLRWTIANAPCTASTDDVTINVASNVTPSVTIAAVPPGTVCSGAPVTFTATPVNGGGAQYQWMKNGDPVGSNSATYTDNGLANGDKIKVVLTSDEGCANPNTATSNEITMSVTTPDCAINGYSTVCANLKDIPYNTPGGQDSYAWSVTGNGTLVDDNIESITVNAGAPGTYTVTLSVTKAGCPATCTSTVTVAETPDLVLNASSAATTATCGDMVMVTISAQSGFSGLSSLDYIIHWDPTRLMYQSKIASTVGDSDPDIGLDNVANGDVHYVWVTDNPDGVSLTDGFPLITLQFKVLSHTGTATVAIVPPYSVATANFCELGIVPDNDVSIALEDHVPPAFDTPADDQTVECDGSGNTTELNGWLAHHGGATATDNCGGTITWTNNYGDANVLSDGCGATGTVTVEFYATDESFNTNTTTAKFTIQDTEKPVLVDADVDCSSLNKSDLDECKSAAESFDATTLEPLVANLYQDNCSDEVTAKLVKTTPGANNSDCSWSFTYDYEITDACENTTSCSVVYSGGDKSAPVLADAQVGCSSLNKSDLDECKSAAESFDATTLEPLVANLYQDNCSDEVTAKLVKTTPGANNSDCSWSFTYDYEITDACENTTSCSVVYSGGDKSAPVLADAQVGCSSLNKSDLDECKSAAESFDATTLEPLVANLYQDNCSDEVTAKLVKTTPGANNSDCSWSFTYDYEITDACENTTSCSVVYSGGDKSAPVLADAQVGCSSLNKSDLDECKSAAESFDATTLEPLVANLYQDNCSDIVTAKLVKTTPGANNSDCSWSFTYDYEITDACENTTSCSVVYSGGDKSAPVLADAQVGCSSLNKSDLDECKSAAESFDATTLEPLVANLYQDNCSDEVTAKLVKTTPGANNSDCSWSFTYDYEITDACENTTSCSVVYSGGDKSAPVLADAQVGCSSLNKSDLDECKSAAESFDATTLEPLVANLYQDNCSDEVTAKLVKTTPGANNSDCSWSFTYDYEITDACENTTSCSVVYSGGDKSAPVLADAQVGCSSLNKSDLDECKSVAESFDATTLEPLVANLYQDNCSDEVTAKLVKTTPGANNSDCSWSFTYDYEITDACENTTSCSVVYSGGDKNAPVLADAQVGCSSLNKSDLDECKSAAESFDATTLEPLVANLYQDNCSDEVTAKLVKTTPGANNSDCSWSFTYDYEITDACENTTSCSVVYSGGDKSAPVLADAQVGCSSLNKSDLDECKSAAESFDATTLEPLVANLYQDNCSDEVTAKLVKTTPGANNSDCSWSFTYDYEITDACENTTSCSVVYSGGDKSAPVLADAQVGCSSLNKSDLDECKSAAESFDATTLEPLVANLYQDNCSDIVTAKLVKTTPGANNSDCSWSFTYDYEITDACENTTSCSVVYSGGDKSAPVLADAQVGCSSLNKSDLDECKSAAESFDATTLEPLVANLYQDNCSDEVTAKLVKTTPGANNSDCSWSFTYDYEITDACENTTSCSVVYSGGDKSAPVLADAQVGCSSLNKSDLDECKSAAESFDATTLEPLVANLYQDNCSDEVTAKLVKTTPGANNSDCSWSFTYDYEITDACENTTSCSVVYSGGDKSAPVLADAQVGCSSLNKSDLDECKSAAESFDATTLEPLVANLYQDNCSDEVTAKLVKTTPGANNSDCSWSFTYDYEITDACENTTSCSVVYSGGDKSAPVLADAQVGCSSLNKSDLDECKSAAESFDATTLEPLVANLYQDNCSDIVTAKLVKTTPGANNSDCSWSFTYDYEITDACENTTSCSVVYSGGDKSAPVLADAQVGCSSLNKSDLDECKSAAESFDATTLEPLVANLYQDNCSDEVTAKLVKTTPGANNSDCSWSFTYDYEITDACENTTSCSVVYSGGDKSAPVLADAQVGCSSLNKSDLDECKSAAESFDATTLEPLVANLYQDNCSDEVTAKLVKTTPGANNSDCSWSFTYDYEITDACENTTSCSVVYSGGDKSAPVLADAQVGCSSLNKSDLDECKSAAESFDATTLEPLVANLYQDNCSDEVTAKLVKTTPGANNSDCSWSFTYDYEITDACENTTSCSVVYSGGDKSAPVLADAQVGCSSLNKSDLDECKSAAESFDATTLEPLVANLYQDNCSDEVTAKLVKTTPGANNSDCSWSFTYDYEITDACENTTSCSVVYSGGDKSAPVLADAQVGCSSLNKSDLDECKSAAESFDATTLEPLVANLYQDNCSDEVTAKLVKTTPGANNSDCSWSFTYDYEITDACENTTSCSVVYSGGDKSAPVLADAQVGCSSLNKSDLDECKSAAESFDATTLEPLVANLYQDNCSDEVTAKLVKTTPGANNSDCSWSFTYDYEITDACENTTSCSVVYSGGDKSAPVLADAQVGCSSLNKSDLDECKSAAESFDATTLEPLVANLYQDNCSDIVTAKLVKTTPGANNSDCSWSFTYDYEITDACENTTSCSVVYSGGDKSAPVLADAQVGCSSLNKSDLDECKSAAESFDATTLEPLVANLYQDNCSDEVTAKLVKTTPGANNSDCSWSFTYDYEITDACENTTSCSVVYSGGDKSAPVLADAQVGCSSLNKSDLDECKSAAESFDATTLEPLVANLYQDNCSDEVTAKLVKTTPGANNSDCSWSFTYDYEITDACENTTSCSVVYSGGDKSAPVLADAQVGCSSLNKSDLDECKSAAESFDATTLEPLVANLYQDNCSDEVTAKLVKTTPGANNSDCSWSFTYDYEITDACENTTSCSVVYSGGDKSAPVLADAQVGCSSLNKSDLDECKSAAESFDATTLEPLVANLYQDNCSDEVTAKLVKTTPGANNSDCSWSFTYDYEITDACENTTSCSVVYSGGDKSAPVLADAQVGCSSLNKSDLDECKSAAESFDATTLEPLVANLYQDNCSDIVTAKLVKTTPGANNSDCSWSFTYDYEITDACENTTSCSVVYSGGDKSAPVLADAQVGCSSLNKSDLDECKSAAESFDATTLEPLVANLYQDNCSDIVTAKLVKTTPGANNSDCSWSFTYDYEITDACENTTSCSVVYSGGDKSAPVLADAQVGCSSLNKSDLDECKSAAESFDATTLEPLVANLYQDNCSDEVTAKLVKTTPGANNSDCSWSFTYDYEITDACENTTSCSVVYSGGDKSAPVLADAQVGCSSLNKSDLDECKSAAESFDATTLEPLVANLYQDNCSDEVTAKLVKTTPGANNSDCSWSFTYDYEITDACENTTSCSVVYSGGDKSAPVLADAQVGCSSLNKSDLDECKSAAESFDATTLEPLVANLYQDNCSDEVTAKLVKTTPGANNSDCSWSFTYDYEITDACENTTSCSVVYSGGDKSAPVLADAQVGCSSLNKSDLDECKSAAESFDATTLEPLVANLYQDNCSDEVTAKLVKTTPGANNSDCSWSFTYDYEITDACENTTSCSVVYSGGDKSAPVLADAQVGCSSLNKSDLDECKSAAESFDATTLEPLVANLYQDNCSDEVTAKLVKTTPGANNSDCSWSFTYDYEITDACENTTSCSVVYSGGDKSAPVLADAQVGCSSLNKSDLDECKSAAESFDATTLEPLVANLYQDNCSDEVTAKLVKTTPGANNSDCSWSFTYDYEITDACENTTSCSVVYSGGDKSAPVLADAQVGCSSLNKSDLDECKSAAESFDATTLEPLVANLYQDNCSDIVTAKLVKTTPGANNSDCSWSFTYDYEITDACENTTSCSVVYSGGDKSAPVLADAQVGCSSLNKSDLDECKSVAESFDATTLEPLVANLYQDNCSDEVTAKLVKTTPGANNSDCSWSFTYDYEITDACENTTSCSVVYSGGDKSAPVLADAQVGCSSLNKSDLDECKSAAESFDATTLEPLVANLYQDNCSDEVTAKLVKTTPGANNSDCSWSFTYDYEITDACENTTSCSVVYSGGDKTPPTASNPAPIGPFECGTDVPDPDPAVVTDEADACGTATVTWTGDDDNGGEGNAAHPLIITRTYHVEDNCGNSIDVTQTITVIDDVAPTITHCPGPEIVYYPNQPDCTYKISGTVLDPEATDNCGLAEPAATFTANNGAIPATGITLNGATFQYGNTTVTWTVTDAAGNESPCTFIVKVLPCLNITGNLIWEGNNNDNVGVGGATVKLTPSPSGPTIDTDGPTASGNLPSGGHFSLTPTSLGDFIVTPSKLTVADPLNGVDASDANLVQQYLLNNSAITDPYKRIAADVNFSNTISATDVAIIRQALLGNPTARNYFSVKPWRFVPDSSTIGNPGANYSLGYIPPANPFLSPIPDKRTLTNVVSDVDSVDFYGIKVGDVNATANPNLHPSNLPPLTWLVQDRALEAGQEFAAQFRAAHFVDIAAWQFALGFDPAVLELESLELPASPLGLTQDENFGFYDVAQGEIRGVWTDPVGANLPEGLPVFTLRFKVLQGGLHLSDVLDLKPKALEPKAYTPDQYPTGLELAYTAAQTTGTNGPAGDAGVQLLQNRPNPFSDRTAIGFILPEGCDAQLRVYDVNGRELLRIDKTYPAGYNEEQIRLDGSTAQGLLFYELTTPFGNLTRKMTASGQ